jgi:hypothetical protein
MKLGQWDTREPLTAIDAARKDCVRVIVPSL